MGALGLLSGPVAVSWPDLLRAAHDRPLAEGSGILVIVTLYGIATHMKLCSVGGR